METTEEVVGQLETGIGASSDRRSASAEGQKSSQAATALDYDRKEEGGSEAAVKGSFAFDAFMYDSDSSREADREYSQQRKPSNIRPLELPFPSQPLPLGVGCSSRPVAYESVTSSSGANAKGVVGTIHQELPEPAMSPFVDATDSQKLAWEQDSWFLVQLPTRLPPLQPTTANLQPSAVRSSDDAVGTNDTNETTRQPATLSDVVTPPVASKSHDNVLTGTAPGRIGKIIVYKSGRTVLKMEGPDGAEPIIMQVSEGLSCSFHQEAVVIDQDTARFIALGNVNKSIVVTPDLSSALVAE
jgi:RNA polymerase III RPC4